MSVYVLIFMHICMPMVYLQFCFGFALVPCVFAMTWLSPLWFLWFPMVLRRRSLVLLSVSLRLPYGFPVVLRWPSYGQPVVVRWFSYIVLVFFLVPFLWFSCGFPVVFLWCSHGDVLVLLCMVLLCFCIILLRFAEVFLRC